ncbi:hypothetical protein AQUSIP_19960 [Aquicella siphonis]|uniref:Uncharacterized protein n=1 Tax=Aquicella siphonis TaxID=254247 RepID=A0A5E4PK41_9COXI|nr:hypothetical protein [Aquicella siphonis]VVC76672.1 hypothetical protein AQUSIP_19960 [Aquicella siphonis]
MKSSRETQGKLGIAETGRRLYRIRDLLYFSVCRPEEFSEWSELFASQEEREVMAAFSRGFQAHYFSGPVWGTGAVDARLKQAFDMRKAIRDSRIALASMLDDPMLFTSEQTEVSRILKSQFLELEKLFNERDQLTCSDKPLPSSQIEVLDANAKSINDLFLSLLICIGRNRDLKPELGSSIRGLHGRFKEFAAVQNEAETAAMNQQRLHQYQAAVSQMMLNESTEKMEQILGYHPGLLKFLEGSLADLDRIHGKFQQYLLERKDRLPQPLSKLEKQDMRQARARAREAFRVRLKHEQEARLKLLAGVRASIYDAYQKGRECHMQGQFEPALLFYLASAKEFHFASLMKAGKMFYKGEGCLPNPGRAGVLFRAAVVCSESESQKTRALARLILAYEQELEVSRKTDTNVASQDKHEPKYRAVLDVIADLKKYILRSTVNPALKLLYLGECYLEMYKVDAKEAGKNGARCGEHFRTAHDFFLQAWNYARRESEKFIIMYVNLYDDHPDERSMMEVSEEDEVIMDCEGVDDNLPDEKEKVHKHNRLLSSYLTSKDVGKYIKKTIGSHLTSIWSSLEAEDAALALGLGEITESVLTASPVQDRARRLF